jgi:predicted DNA-binding protein (MmcQ/YjbR family)
MSKAVPPRDPAQVRRSLLDLALKMPGAYEDHPWGEHVAKVDKKIFVFLGTDGSERPGFGVKLRESHEQAMGGEGITQMGYGLGKAGWVWVVLAETDIPHEVLEDWVEESYRNVALKRRIAELDRQTAD